MNPETETRLKTEADRFDLLEHPELWPEDAASQAELAELLELHLALGAHGQALQDSVPPARRRTIQPHWFMTAAAVLMAVVPSVYALQHVKQQQGRIARIEESAQKRAQSRAWSTFFQQSSELIKRFDQSPAVCEKDMEDRNEERVMALALLEASRQLDAIDAPRALPEAASAKDDLRAWLTELSMEEGCLPPERVEELRRLAANQDLENQAQRLSSLLKGEGS